MKFFRALIFGLFAFVCQIKAQYFIEISVLNTTSRKLTVFYRSQESSCKPFYTKILGNEKKVLRVKVPVDCTLKSQPEFVMYVNNQKLILPITSVVEKKASGVWQGYPLYTILAQGGSYVAEESRYVVRGRP